MKISKNLISRIEKYFEDNKSQITEDIFHLVRVPSVTKFSGTPNPYGEDCSNMLAVAKKLAEDRGFETHNFENYVVTAKMNGEGDDYIGFGVHLDVVPPGEGWQCTEPYNPILSTDGYLIGRGVIDNKGPAVISMYVANCLKELGIPMKHGVKLIMGVNEEKGSNDMDYYVKQEKPPVFNIVPDSQFPVTNGEKGMVFLTLKSPELDGNIIEASGGTVSNMVAESARVVLSGICDREFPESKGISIEKLSNDNVAVLAVGVSAHAATPENGVNAIGRLFEYLLENGLVKGEHITIAKAICRICSDCYGEAFNVPLYDEPSGKLTHVLGVLSIKENRFVIECNMRYPVTIDSEAMVESIKKSVGDMGLTVGFLKNVKPSYVPADKPVVKMVMEAYRTICPDDMSEPVVSGGGTYARVLPNAIAFGAAFPDAENPFGTDRGNPHQPDECVKLSDLLKAGVIYTCALILADNAI